MELDSGATRVPQFGMRALFLTITVCCVALGTLFAFPRLSAAVIAGIVKPAIPALSIVGILQSRHRTKLRAFWIGCLFASLGPAFPVLLGESWRERGGLAAVLGLSPWELSSLTGLSALTEVFALVFRTAVVGLGCFWMSSLLERTSTKLASKNDG